MKRCIYITDVNWAHSCAQYSDISTITHSAKYRLIIVIDKIPQNIEISFFFNIAHPYRQQKIKNNWIFLSRSLWASNSITAEFLSLFPSKVKQCRNYSITWSQGHMRVICITISWRLFTSTHLFPHLTPVVFRGTISAVSVLLHAWKRWSDSIIANSLNIGFLTRHMQDFSSPFMNFMLPTHLPATIRVCEGHLCNFHTVMQ